MGKEFSSKTCSGEVCRSLGCIACCLGFAILYLNSEEEGKLRSGGTRLNIDVSREGGVKMRGERGGKYNNGIKRRFERKGDCGFVTVSGCSIYEKRPDTCRVIEPGGDQCNNFRTAMGLPKIDKNGNIVK